MSLGRLLSIFIGSLLFSIIPLHAARTDDCRTLLSLLAPQKIEEIHAEWAKIIPPDVLRFRPQLESERFFTDEFYEEKRQLFLSLIKSKTLDPQSEKFVWQIQLLNLIYPRLEIHWSTSLTTKEKLASALIEASDRQDPSAQKKILVDGGWPESLVKTFQAEGFPDFDGQFRWDPFYSPVPAYSTYGRLIGSQRRFRWQNDIYTQSRNISSVETKPDLFIEQLKKAPKQFTKEKLLKHLDEEFLKNPMIRDSVKTVFRDLTTWIELEKVEIIPTQSGWVSLKTLNGSFTIRPDQLISFLVYTYTKAKLNSLEAPWRNSALETLNKFFQTSDIDHASLAAWLIERLRGKSFDIAKDRLEQDWSEILIIDYFYRSEEYAHEFPNYFSISREWSALYEDSLSRSFDFRMISPTAELKPTVLRHVEIKEIPDWPQFLQRMNAIRSAIEKATKPLQGNFQQKSLYDLGDEMSLALRMTENFDQLGNLEARQRQAFQFIKRLSSNRSDQLSIFQTINVLQSIHFFSRDGKPVFKVEPWLDEANSTLAYEVTFSGTNQAYIVQTSIKGFIEQNQDGAAGYTKITHAIQPWEPDNSDFPEPVVMKIQDIPSN